MDENGIRQNIASTFTDRSKEGFFGSGPNTGEHFDLDALLKSLENLPKPQALLVIPSFGEKFFIHKMDVGDAWDIISKRISDKKG